MKGRSVKTLKHLLSEIATREECEVNSVFENLQFYKDKYQIDFTPEEIKKLKRKFAKKIKSSQLTKLKKEY